MERRRCTIAKAEREGSRGPRRHSQQRREAAHTLGRRVRSISRTRRREHTQATASSRGSRTDDDGGPGHARHARQLWRRLRGRLRARDSTTGAGAGRGGRRRPGRPARRHHRRAGRGAGGGSGAGAGAAKPTAGAQPSDEAKRDFAAATAAAETAAEAATEEPPRAYADVLILEAKEDHAAHLAELRHQHGAHFLLRLRQFLAIARADRAGVDQRDDAGDPGLLGPSRGQGPQNSLARSEPCLEAMAGLWRTFEAQYEDDRTASLSTETARWSPAHEHQFLLFRSGCRADPGHGSLKSMSRHKSKGLGARDPSHAATVAAKPINLMTNFLTARTDVVADLDSGRAYKDSWRRPMPTERNFVDAVIELIEGRRRRMLDDFDETVDDCRIVARVSRAATFCALSTVPCGANAERKAFYRCARSVRQTG